MKNWSTGAKVGLGLLLLAIIIGAGYYFGWFGNKFKYTATRQYRTGGSVEGGGFHPGSGTGTIGTGGTGGANVINPANPTTVGTTNVVLEKSNPACITIKQRIDYIRSHYHGAALAPYMGELEGLKKSYNALNCRININATNEEACNAWLYCNDPKGCHTFWKQCFGATA